METTKEIPTQVEVDELRERAQAQRREADAAELTFKELDKRADDFERSARNASTLRVAMLKEKEEAEAVAKFKVEIPESVLVYKQGKMMTAFWSEYGDGHWVRSDYKLDVKIRHDDECHNGHNTFAITGDIYVRHSQYRDRKPGGNWKWEGGGCCHDVIGERIPSLTPLMKWHLTSTDGPMHYIANTLYWIETADKPEAQRYESDRKLTRPELLERARHSAVWPDASEDELRREGLVERLYERLPKLMQEFKAAVEGLGLVY